MKYYVIGAGAIGKRHFENLKSLSRDATILGWRTLDLTNLRQQLAAHPSAVIIATATQVRLELVSIAARTDTPIYVEKPLAFRRRDLDALYQVGSKISNRSMVGFMMRYHPIVQKIAAQDLSDVYDIALEIGHDVHQWRQNWDFSKSYAARPDGGGVLLDLCHELDLMHILAPQTKLGAVDCLGHTEFDGVDFSTRVSFHQKNGPNGTVRMDYLSPVSVRRMQLRGKNSFYDIDLLANTSQELVDGQRQTTETNFERNRMFLDIMQDFIDLAETGNASLNPLAPVMDKVYESCALIAAAWEKRQFHGTINGDAA